MKTNLFLPRFLSFVFLLLALCPTPPALSQIPQGFNYQAVAHNSAGAPIMNTTIQVKMGILSDTITPVVVWEELHSSVKTNAYGVFNLVIGKGTRQAGSALTFNDIDWTKTPLFLKVQVYYQGAWKYMGSSRLWSVPYAMVSNDIGAPLKKLAVTGETDNLEEALFEVKNKDGQIIFAVYNEGVRIYVDDGSKGPKGGFAIGGFGTTKAGSQNYLFVSDDSIRAYIDNTSAKGVKGGFAIGGFGTVKDRSGHYFNVSTDTSNIINPSQNRILWYPLKNAFLAGRVLIEKPDSVGENSFATGYESKAKGEFSQAMGYQAIARGIYSTSIGFQSVANRDNSFAFGQWAQARNSESYAFGRGAIAEGFRSFAFGSSGVDSAGLTTGVAYAKGDYSFAIGQGSQALGRGSVALGTADTAFYDFSQAFGLLTKSSGHTSTTFGYKTQASNWTSMAIGAGTVASGPGSLAMGNNSRAGGWASAAFGNTSIASGDLSFAIGNNTKATGPDAFSAGNGTVASGAFSAAFGCCSTEARGGGSMATGNGTFASGDFSFAMGNNSQAGGWASAAFGNTSIASGDLSFAIGNNTKATGPDAFSAGNSTVASGASSAAFGCCKTESSGGTSFAIGSGTLASGGSSFAGGSGSKATNIHSFAFGTNTIAEGHSSFALGIEAKSIGNHSFSLGYKSIASGDGAVAFGNETKAASGNSFTSGYKTQANGWCSDVFGIGTISNSSTTMVLGRYNDTTGMTNRDWYVDTDPAFIIGNGISNTDRKNAFIILQNGNTGIAMVNPQQKLDIAGGNGRVESGYNWLTDSDIRYKKNIEDIENSLEKVLAMHGVRYDLIKDDPGTGSERKNIGFIAQELETVIPEVVVTGSDGYKSVAYDKLTAVLTEAIKEQQKQIESQQKEIDELKEIIKEMDQKIASPAGAGSQ